MVVFIAIVAALFSAPYLIKSHETDVDLVPYYNEYLALVSPICKEEQLHIPNRTKIGFVKKFNDSSFLAVCIRSKFWWEIQVHQFKWVFQSANQKREIMYHEFGHCILNLDHVDNPYNYMYYMNRDLPKEVLELQVLEDAWKVCGQK